MEEYAIPLAALIIAVATFLGTQRQWARAADRDHVQELAETVRVMRDDLAECNRTKAQMEFDVMQLKAENLRLYQRVDDLEQHRNGKL